MRLCQKVIQVNDILLRHEAQCNAMKAYLEVNNFKVALKAYELVRRIERGNFRKDGVTPLFQHQLSVAKYVCTLVPYFLDEADEMIAVAFLHDILEDHAEEWYLNHLEDMFGSNIAEAVVYLSRGYDYFDEKDVRRTVKRGGPSYYADMVQNRMACLIKLIDRAHNIQSMVDVFSLRKQKHYLQETEVHFFPLLKAGRLAYPELDMAFENIKINLRCQCRLIRAIHKGLESEFT